VFERSFKVVMVGDYAVGKTSLLHSYLRRTYKPEYVPTVKAEISEKVFSFPNYVFKVYYWDTPGMSLLDEASKEFYAKAQAAIMVYDVSRKNSLEVVEKQYRSMIDFLGTQPVTWLVGNKIDLKERCVDRSEAERKAKELNSSYIETSAKTGENVDVLFTSVLRDLVRVRLSEVKKSLEK